jgi:hypothetical protein
MGSEAVARPGPWPRGPAQTVATAGVVAAVLSGPLATLGPGVIAVVAAGALVGAVAARPPLAAYVVLAATPLLAGVERGAVLPVVRPNEALLGLVLAGLVLRGLVEVARGAPLDVRLRAVDRAIAALIVAGSILPLLWMVARGRHVTTDDVLFAWLLVKYAMVYAVVRVTIRTEAQVRLCLGLSMAAAAFVAVVAVLQSLGLLGVPGLLATYYPSDEGVVAVDASRGTSTLSSSFAVGDLMVFNIAIASGLLLLGSPRRRLLAVALAVYVLGTIATGQFSSYVGLLVGIVVIGSATGRLGKVLAVTVPGAMAGVLALWPVIARRLSEVDAVSGLPLSWVGPNGRWSNLTTYFWPDLFHHGNWLTGVRVAPRVQAPESWRQWIWIESGHTWLLWSGGVVFFVACLAFLAVAIVAVRRVARQRTDAVGVAAVAALTALWLNVLLMTLDVHLTLRGSADLAFALLALALTRARPAGVAAASR